MKKINALIFFKINHIKIQEDLSFLAFTHCIVGQKTPVSGCTPFLEYDSTGNITSIIKKLCKNEHTLRTKKLNVFVLNVFILTHKRYEAAWYRGNLPVSRRVFGHLESGRKLRTESSDEIPTQY